ncbi:hypothetical protein [Actinomadura macra]|uniref:hypothetical protein n=1 Tax=Actinomadura macra TaxID=46164 RepID=UPI0008360AD8|nr:hypothetical protein [Actinomadura macra]
MFLFAGTPIASDVGFVVTELATNAARHTRSGQHGGRFTVELVLGGLAYIGVTDLGGGGYPMVRLPSRSWLSSRRTPGEHLIP